MSYDEAGNLAEVENSLEYEYDYENRLVKVTDPNADETLLEYVYDALGRRIKKYDAKADETTLYYYDQNWRVIAEVVGGETKRTFVYGNGIDEVLAMIEPGHPMSADVCASAFGTCRLSSSRSNR